MRKTLIIVAILVTISLAVSYFLTFGRPAWLAQSPVSENTLERCDIKKAENPLLDKEPVVVKSKNGEETAGSFKGTIKAVILNPDNLSALVELVSLQGNQSHAFNVKLEEGLAIFNTTAKKDLTILDLKKGQTASLSFSCPQNNNTLFRITQIAVY